MDSKTEKEHHQDMDNASNMDIRSAKEEQLTNFPLGN